MESIINDTLQCAWAPSSLLIFSENVFAPFIYYSHLTSLILVSITSILILYKTKGSLPGILLFCLSTFFSIWVFSDLVLWATEIPQYTMFFWSILILIEPLIYVFAYLFSDALFYKRTILDFKKTLLCFLLILPTLLFSASTFALRAYDYTNCDRAAIEGPLATYGYGIEIVLLFFILFNSFKAYRSNLSRKKEIVILTVGIIGFLMAFSLGNISEVLTENWYIGQIGLFGAPIFVGFLVYVINKFKTIDIKTVSAEILTAVLIFALISLLFVRDIDTIKYVISATIAITCLFGTFLVRSVKNEVKLRENLEAVNTRLIELDKQKSEFVSFATHQLKSPLAAMKGYASLVLDGDYGEVNKDVREAVSRIFESSKTLANVVEDYLNISRIELGTMKYDFVDQDIKNTIEDVIAEIEPNIKKTGIQFSFIAEPDDYVVSVDPDKIKQVFMNLIDNSIKYTPTGKVEVFLKKENKKVIFSVVDTGIGMKPNTIESLFQKFTRAYNANKTNIHGTGLGLYVARQIAEAHHGKVWAMSEGEGKGSQFYVELDAKN